VVDNWFVVCVVLPVGNWIIFIFFKGRFLCFSCSSVQGIAYYHEIAVIEDEIVQHLSATAYIYHFAPRMKRLPWLALADATQHRLECQISQNSDQSSGSSFQLNLLMMFMRSPE
jgi:hypothetical protein